MINDPDYLAKLTLWQQTKAQVEQLTATERRLREELFGAAFPAPIEGTNNAELPEGWKLKGVLKINRTIDEAALPAVKEAVRGMNFNPDPLVKYKPELVLKDYKALPENVRHVFDAALTIKPGLPTIELVPPKVKA
jgi:hypothetical protein